MYPKLRRTLPCHGTSSGGWTVTGVGIAHADNRRHAASSSRGPGGVEMALCGCGRTRHTTDQAMGLREDFREEAPWPLQPPPCGSVDDSTMGLVRVRETLGAKPWYEFRSCGRWKWDGGCLAPCDARSKCRHPFRPLGPLLGHHLKQWVYTSGS